MYLQRVSEASQKVSGNSGFRSHMTEVSSCPLPVSELGMTLLHESWYLLRIPKPCKVDLDLEDSHGNTELLLELRGYK